MKKWTGWQLALLAIMTLVLMPPPAAADRSDIFYPAGAPGTYTQTNWARVGPIAQDKSGFCGDCPNSVDFYRGYNPNQSVYGAGGRHIYASTDPTMWSWTSVNAMVTEQNANGQRPAISFDFQPNATYGSGELHATSWFYTDMPGAEGWSENDLWPGDGKHEQFKIWWTPNSTGMLGDHDYNFEVEFWDPYGNTGGEMNMSQYDIYGPGVFYRNHQASWWFEKWCFDGNNIFTDC